MDPVENFIITVCRSLCRSLLQTDPRHPTNDDTLLQIMGNAGRSHDNAAVDDQRSQPGCFPSVQQGNHDCLQSPPPHSPPTQSHTPEGSDQESVGDDQRSLPTSRKRISVEKGLISSSSFLPHTVEVLPLQLLSKVPNIDFNQSRQEYPNGNVTYKLTVPEVDSCTELGYVGWAMFVYSHNKAKDGSRKTVIKKCMGIYKCSVDMCSFTERPKVPRGSKVKSSLPFPSVTQCLKHHQKLVHCPCDATMKSTFVDGQVLLQHIGIHNHARPHPIRPSYEARKGFEQIVNTAPEVRPQQLLIGTSSRNSLQEIHPSYNNLDRIAHLRMKTKRIATYLSSTMGSLANYEKSLQLKLFDSVSVSAEDGHIIMCTEVMKKEITENYFCMQTDSIEGFVVDEDITSPNVTMTSTYNLVLDRTVPLLVSILFGKTEMHYKKHFLSLLHILDYKTFSEFSEKFPGMVADFSDAERLGFRSAVQHVYQILDVNEIVMEKYYRFCEVHFKQTATRVCHNTALVPFAKEMVFYSKVMQLLNVQPLFSFTKTLSELRSEFPRLSKWFDWHVHPDRGPSTFPALSTGDLHHFDADTNAQESLGMIFQRVAEKEKLGIVETVEHTYRFMQTIACDLTLARTGFPLRYKKGKKQRKRKYSNDGRPPDTTQALVKSRLG